MSDITFDTCTCGSVVVSDAQAVAELKADNERLRAALVEMVQEDATNARRMRAAIVAAREKMAKTRFTWNGMIIQADGILEKALTVNNDRAALEGERSKCYPVQFSDQIVCGKCGLTWDVNDPAPPRCKEARDEQ